MRYSNRSSNKYKQLADDDDEGGGGGGLGGGPGFGRDARLADPSSEGGEPPRGSGMGRDASNGVVEGDPPDGF